MWRKGLLSGALGRFVEADKCFYEKTNLGLIRGVREENVKVNVM